MGIERDDDTTEQLRGDLTDAERTAADKMHDDAFAAAFAFEGDTQPDSAEGSPSPAPAPVAAPAAPTPPAPAPATVAPADDPFKEFSPAVRDMFAKIPELENDNRALRGRVPNLQRENEEMRREIAALKARQDATPAAPAAPAAPKAIDKVRGELPEVADAIEEAVRNALPPAPPPPAPTPPAPSPAAADPEELAMNAAHADWQATMNSTDFKLWTAMQPDAQVIQTSEKAAPVIDALTRFKAHQTAAATRSTETRQRTSKRASAAVAPSSNGAPVTPAEQSEHDAFLEAFNSP